MELLFPCTNRWHINRKMRARMRLPTSRSLCFGRGVYGFTGLRPLPRGNALFESFGQLRVDELDGKAFIESSDDATLDAA